MEATQKQKRASARNWRKAQIVGIRTMVEKIYCSDEMYEVEKMQLNGILLNCESVLRDWKSKPPNK